jgi:ligand-binding SRPBCC domain-containing protein
LPRPIEEVFGFFADAHNLDALTPPWLHFHVVTPDPIVLRPGAIIDYRLRLHGIPITWQSEITVWEAPKRFVDVQRRGPYRQWIHEHRFEPRDGGTWIHDRVEYAVLGGWVEPLVHRWLVATDLCRIFAYRAEQLQKRFGNPDR